MEIMYCQDDVVAYKSDGASLGHVERTHGDVETHSPYPGRIDAKITYDKGIRKSDFKRFMKDGVPPKGTLLIRWQNDQAQLTLESKMDIVDRSFLNGDVVKRRARDAMSGVIINTFTQCTLQPISDAKFREGGFAGAIADLKGLPPATDLDAGFSEVSVTKAPLILNVPASELECADSPTEEDLVVYQDWIGRVTDVDVMIALRLSNNSVVEVTDDLVDHLNGSFDQCTVGDIVKVKKHSLRKSGRWIYGRYNPNTMAVGTVVQTRVIKLEVAWLERRLGVTGNRDEPVSTLERSELESTDFHMYDRTRRPQQIQTDESSSTISNSEDDIRLNLRMRFKDLSGACVKYNGSNGSSKLNRLERKDTLGYDLNVFDVSRFQTEVTVQWQDLSITRERSTAVIPEIGIDDAHDAWPGEIAHSLDLEPAPDLPGVKQARRVGVVQSVNAADRMAKIRWCPDACVQFSDDTDDPDSRSLVTAVVGFAHGGVEEVSLYDIETGELNVRRGDIVLISGSVRRPHESQGDGKDADWVGEVVDTPLDGTLTIRLGTANRVRDVTLRREDVVVTIRSDMSDAVDTGDGEESDSVGINSDGELEMRRPVVNYDGLTTDYGSDVSFDDVTGSESEEDEDDDVRYEDENGDPMDAVEVEDEDWESDSEDEGESDVAMADLDTLDVDVDDETYRTPATSHSASPPDTNNENPKVDQRSIVPESLTNEVEQYLILDTPVPTSHAFSSRSTTTNPTHTKRTAKEHKILRTATNLPKNIYVRTWESRLDLLRVLFVGPEGTPYVDAPFVIDFYLPPTFPADPPLAFFHSWNVEGGLGGAGKVNPNLYEDGKICLSLLGTWESGKGSEGWVAGKSTVLQILVSLQGLVLVKEPYFNEAGYEHLLGLENAKRASELYSERVYLKARTFLLAALDSDVGATGLEGLRDELRWLYWVDGGPGLLHKSRREVEEVLRRSEGGFEEQTGDRRDVVSKGACISLRRILERLRKL